MLGGRKVDNCLRAAESFELIQGVLFRRCYDAVANEVQLRCAVPNVTYGMFELPGRGRKTLGYRERLLLEYHNGPLAGHLGRERTYEHLSRDFWWEGMYEGIRRWCKTCQFCTGERATTGVSAWVRTELYSRPFRVLQYDTVTCRSDDGSPS